MERAQYLAACACCPLGSKGSSQGTLVWSHGQKLTSTAAQLDKPPATEWLPQSQCAKTGLVSHSEKTFEESCAQETALLGCLSDTHNRCSSFQIPIALVCGFDFETGVYCLTMLLRLTSSSQFSHLSLPVARVIGMCRHSQYSILFKRNEKESLQIT